MKKYRINKNNDCLEYKFKIFKNLKQSVTYGCRYLITIWGY